MRRSTRQANENANQPKLERNELERRARIHREEMRVRLACVSLLFSIDIQHMTSWN